MMLIAGSSNIVLSCAALVFWPCFSSWICVCNRNRVRFACHQTFQWTSPEQVFTEDPYHVFLHFLLLRCQSHHKHVFSPRGFRLLNLELFFRLSKSWDLVVCKLQHCVVKSRALQAQFATQGTCCRTSFATRFRASRFWTQRPVRPDALEVTFCCTDLTQTPLSKASGRFHSGHVALVPDVRVRVCVRACDLGVGQGQLSVTSVELGAKCAKATEWLPLALSWHHPCTPPPTRRRVMATKEILACHHPWWLPTLCCQPKWLLKRVWREGVNATDKFSLPSTQNSSVDHHSVGGEGRASEKSLMTSEFLCSCYPKRSWKLARRRWRPRNFQFWLPLWITQNVTTHPPPARGSVFPAQDTGSLGTTRLCRRKPKDGLGITPHAPTRLHSVCVKTQSMDFTISFFVWQKPRISSCDQYVFS